MRPLIKALQARGFLEVKKPGRGGSIRYRLTLAPRPRGQTPEAAEFPCLPIKTGTNLPIRTGTNLPSNRLEPADQDRHEPAGQDAIGSNLARRRVRPAQTIPQTGTNVPVIDDNEPIILRRLVRYLRPRRPDPAEAKRFPKGEAVRSALLDRPPERSPPKQRIGGSWPTRSARLCCRRRRAKAVSRDADQRGGGGRGRGFGYSRWPRRLQPQPQKRRDFSHRSKSYDISGPGYDL